MAYFKQVILVRTDLKMSKGKTAVQVAHGSVDATLKSEKGKISKWKKEGMKKVTLKVSSQDDLYKYAQMAKDNDLVTAIISDAGRTELAPGTVTVCAIGPDAEEKINQITGELKML